MAFSENYEHRSIRQAFQMWFDVGVEQEKVDFVGNQFERTLLIRICMTEL